MYVNFECPRQNKGFRPTVFLEMAFCAKKNALFLRACKDVFLCWQNRTVGEWQAVLISQYSLVLGKILNLCFLNKTRQLLAIKKLKKIENSHCASFFQKIQNQL